MKKLLCILMLAAVSCSPEKDGGVQITKSHPEVSSTIETDNYEVFQGDIMILKDVNKSAGVTDDLWPDGVIYFTVNVPNSQRVYDAIAHWEDNTNLEFKETGFQKNYIDFIEGGSCASYVGMIGGRQPITLSSGCTTGNTIHEIGHAIGLWHEQSREDRDEFITIQWDNIASGREYNFYTYKEMDRLGEDYTDELDFGSIMMYPPYAFSKNGEPTITKKDGSIFSVQRNYLSDGDLEGISIMYPEEEYVNYQYYVISGVRVLRANDLWYYWTKYGFKRVHLRNGRWYWS